MSDVNIKASIEAVLFAIGGALEESKLLEALSDEDNQFSKKELKKLIEELPEGTVYSLQMEVVLTNEQDHGKSE